MGSPCWDALLTLSMQQLQMGLCVPASLRSDSTEINGDKSVHTGMEEEENQTPLV